MSSETSHAKGRASHRGLVRPSGVASRLAPNNTPLAPANKQSRAPWTSRVRTPRHLFVFSTSNAGKNPPTVARRCAPMAPPGFALRSPPPIRASAREKGPRPACARARTHTTRPAARAWGSGIRNTSVTRIAGRRPGTAPALGPSMLSPKPSAGSAAPPSLWDPLLPFAPVFSNGRRGGRESASRQDAHPMERAAGGWEEF